LLQSADNKKAKRKAWDHQQKIKQQTAKLERAIIAPLSFL
jgi:hypothetical protein